MEGPRAEKSDRKPLILSQPTFGENVRRSGLPLRPYVHVRISRISGRRAQLPQINFNPFKVVNIVKVAKKSIPLSKAG